MIFENTDFKDIRAIYAGGQPWFVGKDVCRFFGDKNHSRSLSRVEEENKAVLTMDTNGGKQKMTLINEVGLYAPLFSMQPQKANKNKVTPDAYHLKIKERTEKLNQFRRWVTHEVLPSIRVKKEYVTKELEQMRENARIETWAKFEATLQEARENDVYFH